MIAATNTLSLTAAYRAARGRVRTTRTGPNSWQVTGPFYTDQPRGPTTTLSAPDRGYALEYARHWRAEIVLCAMGYASPDVADALYPHTYGRTLQELVTAALSALAPPKERRAS